jgi:hypothetical protein
VPLKEDEMWEGQEPPLLEEPLEDVIGEMCRM